VTEHVATGTRSGVAGDVAPLVEAFEAQRSRVVELGRNLSPDEWEAPSRCTEWTVHEVVRHLVDVKERIPSVLRGQPTGDTEFDPNTTPKRWLEETAGLTPAETCDELARTTAVQVRAIEEFARSDADRRVPGPYGELHWTMFVLHMFWDSWIHERDVVVPLGRQHESSASENRWAALYGVSLASVPTLMIEPDLRVRERFHLEGTGGGVLVTEIHDEVRVSLDDMPRPDDLHGELGSVIDSLGGRGRDLGEVLAGAPERVARFGYVRGFLRA
jgi:uncharacterized protein (TIGR03083 family)